MLSQFLSLPQIAGVLDSSGRHVCAPAGDDGRLWLNVRVGPHRRHLPAQLGPQADRPLRCRMFVLPELYYTRIPRSVLILAQKVPA